jgi:ABC-type transport system involved in multi-copper enzyme maturation permease subunit
MNKVLRSALITIAIVEAIAFGQAVMNRDPDMASAGLINILLSLVLFFVGLILVIIKSTRSLGAGMLIGSGLLFIIGFSVCSNTSTSFH